MIENRFNLLLELLNDNNKSAQFKELYNKATFVERLELIVILENFLGVTSKTEEQIKEQILKN